MTQTELLRLKSVVERSVRPVAASIYRKGRMREDLLSHLIGAFEEQTSASGDTGGTHEALGQAIRRFGDPSELSAQLQESVPPTDVVHRVLERLWFQPGDSRWVRVGRFLPLHAIILAFFLPAWVAWISVARTLGRAAEPGGPQLLLGSPYPLVDVLLLGAAFLLLIAGLVRLDWHMARRFQTHRDWERLALEGIDD